MRAINCCERQPESSRDTVITEITAFDNFIEYNYFES